WIVSTMRDFVRVISVTRSSQSQIRFQMAWDLRRIRPHFFPRGASVVFGRRDETASPLPIKVEIWSGRVRIENARWSDVRDDLTRQEGQVRRIDRSARSSYGAAFTQGAIFAPRLLFLVSIKQSSPLGLPAGKIAVSSSRSANEKPPWKTLQNLEGVVETEFV